MDIQNIREVDSVKRIAFWVKSNLHAVRVFGGIFFVLALISGLVWALGADVEPVAFVFGLLSSLSFASPSIAEYILPNRKPIREMTYDEILEFILTTDPRIDWNGVGKEWMNEKFLKEDPRLRFRAKYIDDGIQRANFTAPYANCFTDPSATGYWHDLYYDGNLIERFILISVDGARASMPTPDFKSKKVKSLNYFVARLHDKTDTLERYFKESGLEREC